MDLELVSFKLCPFVQRSVITLRMKDVPYRITYIDLEDPPPWFLDISPFGKVPVLRVDRTTVLFESAVINEYIDDVTPGKLLPEDPLVRALNRAWIEFGSACIMDTATMVAAKNEGRFETAREELADKLERIEQELGEGPYFNGESFALIDAAFAPLFMRMALLGEFTEPYDRTQLARVAVWSDSLLALPAVTKSVVADFSDRFRKMVQARKGYAATLAKP